MQPFNSILITTASKDPPEIIIEIDQKAATLIRDVNNLFEVAPPSSRDAILSLSRWLSRTLLIQPPKLPTFAEERAEVHYSGDLMDQYQALQEDFEHMRSEIAKIISARVCSR